MSVSESKGQRWVPLESNPDLFNTYTGQLGLDTTRASFVDVFGFDEDLLAFVPQPVLGTVLLFPVTDALEQQRAEQAKTEAQVKGVIWTKQRVGNACGTFGLWHCLANTPSAPIKPGSALEKLISRSKGKSPIESAEILETDSSLEQAHAVAASGGQTQAPSADERVDLHFCAFVEHDGHLLELDGRKHGPIDHGPIKKDVLRDSIAVAQLFMDLSPGSHEFSLCALVGQPAE